MKKPQHATKKWHYDETGSYNGETTSHNGETTSYNGETTSHVISYVDRADFDLQRKSPSNFTQTLSENIKT